MARLTAQEAARRLGVKVDTVYAYVSRGVLASHKAPDGRTSEFDAAEVEAVARRGRPRRTTRPAALDFAIETSLTSLSPEGRLSYRGLDVTRLARTATFEQAAEFLWTGHMPSGQLQWTPLPVEVPDAPNLVDRLRITVPIAAMSDPLRGDLRPQAVVACGSGLIATLVESLPVHGEGRVPRLTLPDGSPPIRASLAGRLWVRLAPERPRPGMLAVLNAALVLMADHELAASTFAARVAASTRADPYAVVTAGLGPLAGPLHGGVSRAVRRMLDAAAGPEGPGPALAEALELHNGRYPGFGHAVYNEGDPRCNLLLDMLRQVAGGTWAMSVADSVLATVRRRVPIFPNADFALATLSMVANMPPETGEVVFIIARSAGWLAHAIEEYGEAPLRFRPRALYRGSR
jgi:citrate synthase